MELKEISVVIPYFNDSAVFKRALDSVISQTYSPKEIIIIDDCSEDSDKLKKIIATYNFNIRYYRNETNKNGAYSRNFGIRKANSNIIALLDADDFWSIDHLRLSVKALLEKDVDFVYSNYIRKTKIENKVKVTDLSVLKNKFDILFFSPPQTNSFVFKKNIFKKNNVYFDENLRSHQDWQFLITAIANNIKIEHSNQFTSYYCESVRSRVSRVNYDSMFKFWSVNRSLFNKKYLEKYLLNIATNCKIDQGYESLINLIDEYDLKWIVNHNKVFFFLLKFLSSDNLLKFIYYSFYCRSKTFAKVIKSIRGV